MSFKSYKRKQTNKNDDIILEQALSTSSVNHHCLE